jgi:CheY-like chemotaxis protein
MDTEAKETNGPVSGSGTILLVEDDEMVRIVTASLLKHVGYTVVEAETPQEAIGLCEDRTVQMDIILSDVIMHGMSGKEMMVAIQLARPGIKVLFMSGYTSDVIFEKGVDKGQANFIQKPFDIKALAVKIRETLSDP